jgi:hypothetical protein
MDAGFVRERVLADDGLVRLRTEADDRLSIWLAGKRCSVTMPVSKGYRSGGSSSPSRLFERAVARALADAVDGAFDLPRAGLHRGQRIGTARPRSSWQCTLTMAVSPSAFTCGRSVRAYSSGTE